VVADALSRKTADLSTVKAKKAEKRILTLVSLDRIIGPVVSVGTEEEILQEADLVIFIEKENQL
jgi:hypothetical protein